MIVRRHKCEVCGIVYDCAECSELTERLLVMDKGNYIRPIGSRVLLSPDCKRKFECDECKRLLDTECYIGGGEND